MSTGEKHSVQSAVRSRVIFARGGYSPHRLLAAILSLALVALLVPVVPTVSSAASNSYTIEVGKTVSITPSGLASGKKGNSYSWSSSDASIASISFGQTSETATIKGVAAGSATITLTHGYKEKSKDPYSYETKTYTVTVTDSSSSTTVSDADATASSSTSDPTVTVKDTGNKKKISGYHVVVEDADSSYESTENFLKAYHIYLADSAGKEVSSSVLGNGTLNLKVTLTYSAPPSWFSKVKTVKHYKNGSSQAITGVQIGSSSISFTVHGFSDFVMQSGGGSSSETGGTTVTTESNSILENRTFNDANAWQIVSGGYSGNAVANKTTTSGDGYVRVQKNVLPTGTEDEFYVYLSIDTKTVEEVTTTTYDTFLSHKENYQVASASHFPDGTSEGDLVSLPQGSWKGLTQNGGKKNKTYTITYTYGGKTVGTAKFEADCSNSQLYFGLGNDRYIAVAVFKEDSEVTVPLSEAAYKELVEVTKESHATTHAVTLNHVSDELGSGIQFLDTEKADGSASAGNGVITWSVTKKSSPQTSVTSTSDGANSSTTTWNLNVAELLYKVKLNTQASGFNSAGVYGTSNTIRNPSATYNTNGTTRLSYTVSGSSASVDFTSPVVRGNNYDLKVLKMDQAGEKLLAGATFTIERQEGAYNSGEESEWSATTDSDGAATITGLPWGTYTITETSAPEGYVRNKDTRKAVLSQTLDANGLTRSSFGGTNTVTTSTKVVVDGSTHPATDGFTNTLATVSISLTKTDSRDSATLAGAVFQLYEDTDGNGSYDSGTDKVAQLLKTDGALGNVSPKTTGSNGTLTFTDVVPSWGTDESAESGVFFLVETSAPSGYVKLAEPVSVTVTKGRSDGSTTFSATDGSAADEPIEFSVLKYVKNADGTADTTQPLANAGFTLYKDSACTQVASTSKSVKLGQTMTDASGSLTWTYVPAGTYYLKETWAPTGYQIDPNVHTVVVSDTRDGNANLITVDGSAPSNPNTITIADAPNPVLPVAAGPGVLGLLLAGLGATGAGAALVARGRRREARGR